MRSSKSSPAGEFPVLASGAGVLLQAAIDGDIDVVKKRLKASLFRKGDDVNRRDDRECTALHYAAKTSHIPLASLLLAKGADLSVVDKHGWSVLHYAVRYGTEEMVMFLMEMGSDVGMLEKRGWSLLHLAARNGMANKARLLLENGADIGHRQSQGWNALHLAVRYGQPDTISTLLEYGIGINEANSGWTALHLAALNGHLDIVSILLNKRADTSLTNRDEKTALDICREEGHERIAAIIMETEFQGEVELPTPPPTPPSAPTLDMMAVRMDTFDLARRMNTFDQWRVKLQRDLENISNDDISSENDNSEEDDVRILWKSFEEEKVELLQQLERSRQREITRIRDEIERKKDKHQVAQKRMDKKRQLLDAQIENMRMSIPNRQEGGRIRYQTLKEEITQLSVLLENSRVETDLLTDLQNHQIESELTRETRDRKRQLLEQMTQIQKEERQLLETMKKKKYSEIDNCEIEAEREVEKAVKRIKVLETELELLKNEKSHSKKVLENDLKELDSDLEKAERHRVIASENEEDDQLACPVCLELLRPPLRIFQCPEGHILCENCRDNPSLVHCPQCRVPLEGVCSRNRALEEVARTVFNVQ